MTPAEEKFWYERVNNSVTKLIPYFREVCRRQDALNSDVRIEYKGSLVSAADQPPLEDFDLWEKDPIESNVCATLWKEYFYYDHYANLSDLELSEELEKLFLEEAEWVGENEEDGDY